MDGSTVVIPSATPPGGLAREDALFRIVYYGEALRAMTEHVSDALISGQCAPMIEMLDEAFDRMSQTRDSFGPEEFTLFVMSKMLGLCDDATEARQFQVGAARYIVKAADALPDEYKPVIDDARQMLRRTAQLGHTETTADPAGADASPPRSAKREPATGEAAAPKRTVDTPSKRPETQAAPSRNAALPGARPQATSRPTPTTHYTREASPSGRLHFGPARRSGGLFKILERFLVVAMIAFALGITVLLLTDNLDTRDFDTLVSEPATVRLD